MRRGFLDRRVGEPRISAPGDATQRATKAPFAEQRQQQPPQPFFWTPPEETLAAQRATVVRLCGLLEGLERRCDNVDCAHLRPQLASAQLDGRFALVDGSEDALRGALYRLGAVNRAAAQHVGQLEESAELMFAMRADDWEDKVDEVIDAVLHSDMAALHRLFDSDGLPVDSHTGRGQSCTWLNMAAGHSTPPVLRFFLERGAALETRDVFGDTPLLSAARKGLADNVALLLAAGADVRAANMTGSTALHLSVMFCSLACVQLLVRAGASLSARTFGDGFTPVFFATTSTPPVLRYLLDTGGVDFTLRSGWYEARTLLANALRPCVRPHANVMRQMVVEEAYRRELAQPGSGDPEGVLGLGPAPRPRCRHATEVQGCCPHCTHFAFSFGHRLKPDARYIPDSDPAQPPAMGAAYLPRRGRVLRYRDGASVAQPSELAPSQFVSPSPHAHAPAMLALLMATHARCGADSPARTLPRDAARLIASQLVQPRRACAPFGCKFFMCTAAAGAERRCACVLAQQPCFQDCPVLCRRLNPLNALRVGGRTLPLSDCAADHLDTVRALSEAQLRARYPLACLERWGDDGHHVSGGDDATVALADVLSSDTVAAWCCACRGEQVFSFCLGRVVNADRVKHCLCCGRCFYFRPGRRPDTCPYCAGNTDGRDAPRTPMRMDDQDADTSVESEQQKQLAREGYWGR